MSLSWAAHGWAVVPVAVALSSVPPATDPLPRGQWPITPARVIGELDLPAHDWEAGHRGLDLAADASTDVRAAAAGTVTFAGPLAGRGVVVVDHGTVRTTYEPVTASVGVGDVVERGDRLGVVSPTEVGHCVVAHPCLHWGLRRGEAYLDPRLLIDGPRVAVLIPWDDP